MNNKITRITISVKGGHLANKSTFAICLAVISWGLVDAAKGQVEVPVGGKDTSPVVIRLSESLFNSQQRQIYEHASVDQCVLQIRNRGTSKITGRVSLDVLSSSEDAILEIVFQGQSDSCTTGNRGPATIHGNVTSQFELRSLIAFDESLGFKASPTQGECRIVSASQRVSTTAPRLRGRIVRRVAYRRLSEKQGTIRAIARKNTLSRLIFSMDRRLLQGVAAWNDQWKKLSESLRQQAWYPAAPKLTFVSTEEHLLILVSDGTTKLAATTANELKPDDLPESRTDTVADILVDTNWLTSRTDAEQIVAFLAASTQPLLVLIAEPATIQIETSAYKNWTAFHFVSRPNE